MCSTNQDCRCISDILKIILILQKKAHVVDDGLKTCDRKALGGSCSCCVKYNTRPVQLFLVGQNGDDPLVMPTTRDAIDETTVFSNVFRVEKVDDCCATFRVLVPDKKCHDKHVDFEATNSFFTIDLRCVCIIRCLDDTFVDCVC